jgi:CheY-like chemotaxis protein
VALESAGYRVRVAADGREALAIVDSLRQPPDLLVTDVVMPGLSGTSLADTLRSRWPSLKVMFISGYAADCVSRGDLPDEVQLLDKPFTPAALLAKVREVLDR